MTSLTIDVDQLAATLARSVNQDLGYVQLIPGLLAGQTIDPSTLPTVPAIMAQPLLIPGVRYRFPYQTTRYLRLTYLAGRAGLYESGTLDIISNAGPWAGESSGFTAPTLTCVQSYFQRTGGALGLSFFVATDVSTLGSDTPNFGITYQITATSPAVFPTVRMSITTALPIESP